MSALDAWLPDAPPFALDRVLVVVAALIVPFAMAEMGYLHHRGNFHRWPMYLPVAIPPFFVVAALVLLLVPGAIAAAAFATMSLVLVLLGFAGVFFHVQGIGRQTGGFNLDNVMVGPPLFAPLSFSLAGLLGLLALAWGSAG